MRSSSKSFAPSRAGEAASWAGLVLRAAASAVWIIAGAAKIPQLQELPALVQRYGILPAPLAVPFAFALPARRMSLDRRLFNAPDVFAGFFAPTSAR